METATLVLEFTRALIWPFVVLVLIIILRKRLGGLVDRVSSVEALGANLTFNQTLESASHDLRSIEQANLRATENPISIVQSPEVAEAAEAVLSYYRVWPRLYRSGQAAPDQLHTAWRQLRDVVAVVQQKFEDIDHLVRNLDEPEMLLSRLADVTGVPMWQELAEITATLRPDLLSAQGRTAAYPYFAIPPPFDAISASVAESIVNNLRSRRTRRLAEKYVDAIDEVIRLIRELMDLTARAHTVSNRSDP